MDKGFEVGNKVIGNPLGSPFPEDWVMGSVVEVSDRLTVRYEKYGLYDENPADVKRVWSENEE